MSYVEDVIRQLNQGATPAPRYTYDFKLAAVEQVKGGKTVHFVANTLGVAWDTLNSWVKAEKAGKLEGPPTEEISKMQNPCSDFSKPCPACKTKMNCCAM